MWGPTQDLAPIVYAVLTFIEYKQTDKHPDKQSIHIVTPRVISITTPTYKFYLLLELDLISDWLNRPLD